MKTFGVPTLENRGILRVCLKISAQRFLLSACIGLQTVLFLGGRCTSLCAQSVDDFNPNANNFLSSLAIQADSEILVGGAFFTMGGTSVSGICRLATNGDLDTSFKPAVSSARSLSIQEDGKIVYGGASIPMVRSTRR